VDLSQHAETAYSLGEILAGHFNPLGHRVPAASVAAVRAGIEPSARPVQAREDTFA
jgi:hypothetical protein